MNQVEKVERERESTECMHGLYQELEMAREQGHRTRVAGEAAEGIKQFVNQAEEPGNYSLGNEKPSGGPAVEKRWVRWREDRCLGYPLTLPGSNTEAQ